LIKGERPLRGKPAEDLILRLNPYQFFTIVYSKKDLKRYCQENLVINADDMYNI
jgi:hypothetical protein